jgi:hypothetical protein
MLHDLENLKRRLDSRLNNHLCKMAAGYDDSVIGFNEAWDIVHKFFADVARESRSNALVVTSETKLETTGFGLILT